MDGSVLNKWLFKDGQGSETKARTANAEVGRDDSAAPLDGTQRRRSPRKLRFAQGPSFGPVVLLYHEAPYGSGRQSSVKREMHASNLEALACIAKQWGRANIKNAMITEENGNVVWSTPELESLIDTLYDGPAKTGRGRS